MDKGEQSWRRQKKVQQRLPPLIRWSNSDQCYPPTWNNNNKKRGKIYERIFKRLNFRKQRAEMPVIPGKCVSQGDWWMPQLQACREALDPGQGGEAEPVGEGGSLHWRQRAEGLSEASQLEVTGPKRAAQTTPEVCRGCASRTRRWPGPHVRGKDPQLGQGAFPPARMEWLLAQATAASPPEGLASAEGNN